MANRVVLNLGPHTSGDRPFINMMKECGGFTASGYAFPAILDANGYPVTASLSNTIAGVVGLSPVLGADTTRHWVFKWAGNGGTNALPCMQLSGAATIYSGSSFVKDGVASSSIFAKGTSGRIEFSWNAARLAGSVPFSFVAGANFDGTLSDVVLCRADQESLYDAGEIFNPDWLDVIADIKPGVIRLMQWSNTNNGNVAQAISLFSQDALGYGQKFEPTHWAGIDSTNTNAYALTVSDGTLTEGKTWQCQLVNAPSAAVTFTVSATSPGVITRTAHGLSANAPFVAYNSGGALPAAITTGVIYYVKTVSDANNFTFSATPGGTAINVATTGTGTHSYTPAMTVALNGGAATPILTVAGSPLTALSTPTTISANSFFSLVYDSVLGGFLAYKGGHLSGVPIADMIALAIKTNRDVWYCFPTHASDAFVTTIAAEFRAGLAGTGLNAWFEYSNEVWNFNDASFPQTNWAVARGLVYGFPLGNNERYHGTYALRVRQIMGLVTTAFNGSSAFKRVISSQGSTDIHTVKKWRFEGFDLNPALGFAGYNSLVNVDYSVSGNQPIDYVDIIAYGAYYNGAQLASVSANFANTMTTDGPAGYTVGLLGAADDYATGTPALMEQALDWVHWDLTEGTRNGTAGAATLDTFHATKNIGLGAIGLYPSWDQAAVTYNKPTVLYEAAMEASYPTAARCTALGISTAYGDIGGKINVLLTAYKNNYRFSILVIDQLKHFMAQSKSMYSSWYQITSLISSSPVVADQWALYQGDIYSTPFKSLEGLTVAGAGKQRFIGTI